MGQFEQEDIPGTDSTLELQRLLSLILEVHSGERLSREHALFVTKIEEAAMWLHAHIKKESAATEKRT